MKRTILIVTSILLVNLFTENVLCQYSKTKWLDGEWTGIGYQPYALSQNAWKVILKYNYADKKIEISYPSFPCGGGLKLIKATKNKAEFISYITDGKTLCQDNETVIITRIDDNYITISYFMSDKKESVSSFSTLQREVKQFN